MGFKFNSKTLGIGLACCVLFGVFAIAVPAQSGPSVGDQIDLSSFRNRKGRSLAEALQQHSVALLVLVDPGCASCVTTKDSLAALRQRVGLTRIAYYVVIISDGSDTQKCFDFADSLKLEAESFVWSNHEVKAPASLLTMTKPSHLQVTPEGLVVEKWLGTPAKDATP